MVDIEIKRGYEVLPDNSVRFGIRVINNSPAAILDVEVILGYPESLFSLQDGRIQNLGNIPPTGERTAKFLLKPLGCVHQEYIGATVQYNDHTYEKHLLSMHRKEIHCVCPFLRAKSMSTAQFLELSSGGHSVESGLRFEGVSVEQVLLFLMQACTNRLYKVEERSVKGGKILYLSSESQGEKAYYLLTVLIKEDKGLTQVMLRAVSDKTHGLQGFLNEVVSELKHLVSTLKSAREIGVIRHEQVINIIDSVVQHSNFSVDGSSSGSVNVHNSVVQRSDIGSSLASVNIQDSVVQRTTIISDNGKKEEDGRKTLEAIRLKAGEEAEQKKKADEGRRRREEINNKGLEEEKHRQKQYAARKSLEDGQKVQNSPSSSSKILSAPKPPSYTPTKRQRLPPKKKSGKNKVLMSMFVLLLLGGVWMGFMGDDVFMGDNDSSDSLSLHASADSNDETVASVDNTDDEADDSTVVSTENVDDEADYSSYSVVNLETYTNSIGMEFVLIPVGEFMMGSPSDERDRGDDEGPVHKVTIEEAYYLGTYEVTQGQWEEVMGDNPSYFEGDDRPVEQVSWKDVQEFVEKLNEIEDTNKYRLPSEAEWEYACRAGTDTRYSFGDSWSYLDDYAWYSSNSEETHPVGQKQPNPWGLYDVHGNVWEWCQDRYHDGYEDAPTDGSAWEKGNSSFRVVRGLSWRGNVRSCRSADRAGLDPGYGDNTIGFRLLREM